MVKTVTRTAPLDPTDLMDLIGEEALQHRETVTLGLTFQGHPCVLLIRQTSLARKRASVADAGQSVPPVPTPLCFPQPGEPISTRSPQGSGGMRSSNCAVAGGRMRKRRPLVASADAPLTEAHAITSSRLTPPRPIRRIASEHLPAHTAGSNRGGSEARGSVAAWLLWHRFFSLPYTTTTHNMGPATIVERSAAAKPHPAFSREW